MWDSGCLSLNPSSTSYPLCDPGHVTLPASVSLLENDSNSSYFTELSLPPYLENAFLDYETVPKYSPTAGSGQLQQPSLPSTTHAVRQSSGGTDRAATVGSGLGLLPSCLTKRSWSLSKQSPFRHPRPITIFSPTNHQIPGILPTLPTT